jgi:hypothetical protein
MSAIQTCRAGLAVLVLLGCLIVSPDARGRVPWDCSNDSDFQWCSHFMVHNTEYLGSGGLTEGLPTGTCSYAWVGVETWLSGPVVEDDGYELDEGAGYAETSSSSQAPSDSSFFGVYTAHSNHWVEDFFNCGTYYLQENRTHTWEITM